MGLLLLVTTQDICRCIIDFASSTDAGITYASCSSQAATFVTSVPVIRRSSSMVIHCVQIAKFELLYSLATESGLKGSPERRDR
jgi:hypothetical protein